MKREHIQNVVGNNLNQNTVKLHVIDPLKNPSQVDK